MFSHWQVFNKVREHVGLGLGVDHFHVLCVVLASFSELCVFLDHTLLVVDKYRHNGVEGFDKLQVHKWAEVFDELGGQMGILREIISIVMLLVIFRFGLLMLWTIGCSDDKNGKGQARRWEDVSFGAWDEEIDQFLAICNIKHTTSDDGLIQVDKIIPDLI